MSKLSIRAKEGKSQVNPVTQYDEPRPPLVHATQTFAALQYTLLDHLRRLRSARHHPQSMPPGEGCLLLPPQRVDGRGTEEPSHHAYHGSAKLADNVRQLLPLNVSSSA